MFALHVNNFKKEIAAANGNEEQILNAYIGYVWNGKYDADFNAEAIHFFLNSSCLRKRDCKLIADYGSDRFGEIKSEMIEKFLQFEIPTNDELRWAVDCKDKKAWEMLKERFTSTEHKKNYRKLWFSHVPGEHEEALRYKAECPYEVELQEIIAHFTINILSPDWVRPEAIGLLRSLDN